MLTKCSRTREHGATQDRIEVSTVETKSLQTLYRRPQGDTGCHDAERTSCSDYLRVRRLRGSLNRDRRDRLGARSASDWCRRLGRSTRATPRGPPATRGRIMFPSRCPSGRRGWRCATRATVQSGHHEPAVQAPAAFAEAYVAGLHEPIGGQRLGEVVDEAVPADRKPAAAEQREHAHQTAHRRADRVRAEQVPERDPERREGHQPDEQQPGHRQPAAGRQAHAERRPAGVQHDDAEAGQQVSGQDLRPDVGTRARAG